MSGEQGAPPWPLGLYYASQNYGIPLAPTLWEADTDLLRAIALCLAVRRSAKTPQLHRTGADWELLSWMAGDAAAGDAGDD